MGAKKLYSKFLSWIKKYLTPYVFIGQIISGTACIKPFFILGLRLYFLLSFITGRAPYCV
jgi:hypothetical protein